jgi:hypothetical protein
MSWTLALWLFFGWALLSLLLMAGWLAVCTIAGHRADAERLACQRRADAAEEQAIRLYRRRRSWRRLRP